MTRETARELTLQLIYRATRAGAFRAAAREFPDGADVLMRAAEKNSADVADLAAKLAALGDGSVA